MQDINKPQGVIETGLIEVLPRQATATGMVELRVEPKFVNLACSSLRATATINVGCPPSKTIQIIPPTQYIPQPPTTPRVNWSDPFAHGNYYYQNYAIPTVTTDCDQAPSMITLRPYSWISDWSQGTYGATEKVQLNNLRTGFVLQLHEIWKPYSTILW